MFAYPADTHSTAKTVSSSSATVPCAETEYHRNSGYIRPCGPGNREYKWESLDREPCSCESSDNYP